MADKYVAPKFDSTAFHCARCGVFAQQAFAQLAMVSMGGISFHGSRCSHCNKASLWHDQKLVFPAACTAPEAHEDMPGELKGDYEEARQIVATSPRGEAALLRLVLQKLMKHLGQPGKDINTDIGELVKQGLPVKIQRALDAVRVIGNEAVHP